MQGKTVVKVGLSTCGIAAGGQKTYAALAREITKHGLDVELRRTGCIGMCYIEPIVEIISPVGENDYYGAVTEDKAVQLVEEHLLKSVPPYGLQVSHEKENVFSKQVRVALRNCGDIDPESISDYRSRGGYESLRKALLEMSPEQVIGEMLASGLRGRGGAGFLTGLKWRFTRAAKGEIKYLVCNADEGDPGAFMDRSIIEGDPHAVLEGMLLAAYAIGASVGYVYVRAEYPLAIVRLEKAIEAAREAGFLGENILGTNFNFILKIKKGAGAFVCGEETALLASLEGERGMPRLKPPFPAEQGLWKKPTCINNVETFANVPWIILNGGDKFKAYGTEKSSGTKVFALAGKIRRGGLIEVPMGITLREIVFEVGGGIPGGKNFKGIQLGGPSGGCVPESLLDTPVDYESIVKTGAIVGSGGMIVMDETTCMVDMARFFLNFAQNESCGKCTHCRVGTKRMLEILVRITEGKAQLEELDLLYELALEVKEGSLCGLGQTAPNPVLTTLKYFREEYETHLRERKCPAKVCRELLSYTIDAASCTGCGLCTRRCPTAAITGEKKAVHIISQEMCVRCGNCYDACKVNAVLVE
ncbi:MAG: NADP-reducing hydrogenase subunit HndC [Syntrophomonadaceae bacterium]|nr:NADP-reducing hydrogenase subunit HndC [Bacillota bacterium]